ncbi:Seven cysteines N-terminal [Trinorchestia longiramus]|nr:Seven cysteines N-terminal [Trinorchestia longiramus]
MPELRSVFVLSMVACAWTMVRSSSDVYTHDRKRPVPLLDANHGCFQRFEVSENTIIRAQDSRQLGAKFLNESDVGNREDCMALCCRTTHCTVAVFEEKNAGSCFLFDCGNSDNFVCQFTTHAYYTSTRIRDLPSLPITSVYLQQQQQKQQEEERQEEIREKELAAQQKRKQEQEESIVWSRPKNLHEQELNNLRRSDFKSTSGLGQTDTRTRPSLSTAGQAPTKKDTTTSPPPVDSTKDSDTLMGTVLASHNYSASVVTVRAVVQDHLSPRQGSKHNCAGVSCKCVSLASILLLRRIALVRERYMRSSSMLLECAYFGSF